MIGIIPTEIPYTLSPIVGTSASATVLDKEARVRAIAGDYIAEEYAHCCPRCTAAQRCSFCALYRPNTEDSFVWKHNWRALPYEILARTFTFNELVRIWHDEDVTMSELSEHIDEQHPLLWKVRNSLWRYGCGDDYNQIVAGIDGLKRLGALLPADFTASIVHTRGCNTAAWALQAMDLDVEDRHGIYLDGPFGLLLYYKGAHVMTIGFAIARHGIAIAQIQLRKKRGNRFLYKLPLPYLDYAIQIIGDAFAGQPLWLVEGVSAAVAVRRSYGKAADQFNPATAARIQTFYDQPLRSYARVALPSSPRADDGRTYVKLERIHHLAQKAA